MYFMLSGTVMRASSQMWKKLSTVVRDVKMMARVGQDLDPLAAEFLERHTHDSG